MQRVWWFTLAVLASLTVAASANLEGVRSYPLEDEFVTELSFAEHISSEGIELRFNKQVIEAILPKAKFGKKKVSTFINNKKRGLRFVEASHEKGVGVVARLVFTDANQMEAYRDKVSVESQGKILKIRLRDAPVSAASVARARAAEKEESPAALPLRLSIGEQGAGSVEAKATQVSAPVATGSGENVADKLAAGASSTLVSIAEPPVSNGTTQQPTAKSEANLPLFTQKASQQDSVHNEAEIPLHLNEGRVSRSEGDHVQKLILTMVILFATVGISVFFLRRSAHGRAPRGSHRAIRVLASHYLGPKRSLALISVAGETMLIGITDHSINLLKNLALLEEEIPTQVPKDFSSSLEQAEEQDGHEEFAMAGLRDVVAKKLKQMRPI